MTEHLWSYDKDRKHNSDVCKTWCFLYPTKTSDFMIFSCLHSLIAISSRIVGVGCHTATTYVYSYAEKEEKFSRSLEFCDFTDG